MLKTTRNSQKIGTEMDDDRTPNGQNSEKSSR